MDFLPEKNDPFFSPEIRSQIRSGSSVSWSSFIRSYFSVSLHDKESGTEYSLISDPAYFPDNRIFPPEAFSNLQYTS